MDAGGHAKLHSAADKEIVEDNIDDVRTSSPRVSSNPAYHQASLALSVPVRCLYHEQAKSIVAIQVRLLFCKLQ